MSNFNDRKVHFINLGLKGFKCLDIGGIQKQHPSFVRSRTTVQKFNSDLHQKECQYNSQAKFASLLKLAFIVLDKSKYTYVLEATCTRSKLCSVLIAIDKANAPTSSIQLVLDVSEDTVT